jgi:hypothetical protein
LYALYSQETTNLILMLTTRYLEVLAISIKTKSSHFLLCTLYLYLHETLLQIANLLADLLYFADLLVMRTQGMSSLTDPLKVLTTLTLEANEPAIIVCSELCRRDQRYIDIGI